MRHRLLIICACIALGFAAAQSQLLYRISGNGLEKPSYLFGTHHLAPLSILDSIPYIYKALDETDAVTGEIEMAGISQIEMANRIMPYMLAPADSTLCQVLPDSVYSRANASFQSITNMRLELFEGLCPMAIQTMAAMAMVKEDFSGNEGQLDSYLQDEGAKRGKEIMGFETLEEQASLLYRSASIREQADALVKFLDNPDKEAYNARELNSRYMARDIEGVYALSRQESDDPEFWKRLLTDRNNNWLSKMPRMMDTRSVLFVVGALHLAGNEGLIEGLRKMGYTVTSLDDRQNCTAE
ncbi:MAG TPA: hypothetical protein DC009_06655 [Porphyromonadaceae bacterium]|nr:hypothetical protein [Porphyromonadaceae bacterium]